MPEEITQEDKDRVLLSCFEWGLHYLHDNYKIWHDADEAGHDVGAFPLELAIEAAWEGALHICRMANRSTHVPSGHIEFVGNLRDM